MPHHTPQLTLAFCLVVGLLPMAAAAQPATSARFAGTAIIGSETRQIGLHISCSVSRGRVDRLDAELDLPAAEQFERVFDVGKFEGPTGIGGRMHIAAAGASGTAQVDLSANGSFGNNGLPGTTFTLGAAATAEPKFRAKMQKFQAVVAVLSSGPAKFTWQVDNPTKGGQPINATAEISDADAARIRAAVARCKAR